jgi:hypothetical protein
MVAADSDPAVEADGSDPADDEGRCSTRLQWVDHRTSDLVDGETVGGGEEQVVVLRSSAYSPVDRSRVVFAAAAATAP